MGKVVVQRIGSLGGTTALSLPLTQCDSRIVHGEGAGSKYGLKTPGAQFATMDGQVTMPLFYAARWGFREVAQRLGQRVDPEKCGCRTSTAKEGREMSVTAVT